MPRISQVFIFQDMEAGLPYSCYRHRLWCFYNAVRTVLGIVIAVCNDSEDGSGHTQSHGHFVTLAQSSESKVLSELSRKPLDVEQ